MITEQVTSKIEKMAKATKPKAKVAKQRKSDPVAPAVAKVAKQRKSDPVAPAVAEPVIVVVAPVAAPVVVEPVVAPAAPAIPPALKDQVFADFGLRQGTHRAVMVSHLIDHLNEQVPFATLAAIAWAGVQQKTNTTTSVSTSVKKLERRIIRNKLEDRYTIRREVIDGSLTAGLYRTK